MSDVMQKFYDTIKEGVARADKVRAESTQRDSLAAIREVQEEMKQYASEVNLRQLITEVLQAHPEKKTEIQKRVIALHGEGKQYEDSMLIK